MTTKNTNSKKILLVDDDIDYLNQTKSIIENFGHEVIAAYGQKEAEEVITKHQPDLVILDLMMENKDSGFILSWKIKQTYPSVPVIIATAVTADTGMVFELDSEDDKKWIKADLYLEKGLRPDQLKCEINKLLRI